MKPFSVQWLFGRFSIRPKRVKRIRNSRTLVVPVPISRASSSSLICMPGCGIVGEDPLHEAALDDVVQRIRLFGRKEVAVRRLAQHDLLALVPADDAFLAQPGQDGARGAAADAELGGDLRLRGQRGIGAQALRRSDYTLP